MVLELPRLFFKMIDKKKGVSGLITVTLMILITISLALVVGSFLIPFVRDSLNDSSRDCYKLLDTISFSDGSCYEDGNTDLVVRFDGADVNEIYLVVEDETGKPEVYFLKDGEAVAEDSDIENYAGEVMELPSENGGQRVYSFGFQASRAEVGAVIGDNQCPAADSIEVMKC